MCAACAALSDSVKRKILIPARVPFSDFYFYVLSFNFGAAAAAPLLRWPCTPAAAACVRAPLLGISLFSFSSMADLVRWLARSLSHHDTENLSFRLSLSLQAASASSAGEYLHHTRIYVLITTSLGCHFVGSQKAPPQNQV
jgi:hypothetical protein